MKAIRTLLLIFVLLGSLSACSKTQPVPQELQADLIATADPITDRLLAALAANDYDSFIQDMEPKMKAAMTQEQFADLRQLLDSKAGAYQSRQLNTVEQNGDFYIILYTAAFEKSPAVTMRIVLTNTAPYQLTGLWFDSPELRQK
jgi:hypothetical protein